MKGISAAFLLLFLCVLPACGGEETAGNGGDSSTSVRIATVASPLTFPEDVAFVSHEVPDTVVAVGNDAGTIVAGTPTGLYGLFGTEFSAISVYSAPGEPIETGGVTAIGRRGAGILVAAEDGLFYSSEGRLIYAPMSLAVRDLDIGMLHVVGAGENEVIWFGGETGVFVIVDFELGRFTLPGVEVPPSALAATEEYLVVAYGERIFEVRLTDLSYVELPADFGRVFAIDTDGTRFAIATERGVLVREPSGEYRRFTLSGEQEGSRVDLLASDPTGGWIGGSEAGLFRIDGESVTGLAPWPWEGEARKGTVDDEGNVWIGTGTTLTMIATGTTIGFTADVAPIFDRKCNTCHLEGVAGAPRHDFTHYEEVVALADTILERLSTGQMPPAGLDPLTDEEFDTYLRWYTGGRLE